MERLDKFQSMSIYRYPMFPLVELGSGVQW